VVLQTSTPSPEEIEAIFFPDHLKSHYFVVVADIAYLTRAYELRTIHYIGMENQFLQISCNKYHKMGINDDLATGCKRGVS
jgi:hypothetical protein